MVVPAAHWVSAAARAILHPMTLHQVGDDLDHDHDDITTAVIDAAARRIAPHVRETPLWVLPSSALELTGRGADAPAFEAWFKLEQLQVSGSFKARGMFNRLLSNGIPKTGVIAA